MLKYLFFLELYYDIADIGVKTLNKSIIFLSEFDETQTIIFYNKIDRNIYHDFLKTIIDGFYRKQ